jgi:translocation and assembly module TamA
MRNALQASGFAALFLAAWTVRAGAFEIFGIKFFESEAARVEVIDPQTFRLSFEAGGGAVEERLKAASALWSGRRGPVSGDAGLIALADGDYGALLDTLYDLGHYGAVISIRIGGAEAAGLDAFAEFPEGVKVEVAVDPGPRFTFGRFALVNAPPGLDPPRTGDPARAGAIRALAEAGIEAWRDRGHALARISGEEFLADHPNRKLSATLAFDPGPKLKFGLVAVEGSTAVERDFLIFMSGLRPGRAFSPAALDQAETRLAGLGTFTSVRLVEGAEAGPDGTLPVTIAVSDRLPRRFGLGAELSTLEGLSLSGFWLHRNLWGRAEQLRLSASIAGLGESDELLGHDLALGADLTLPGFIHPDTVLVLSADAAHLRRPAYREDRLTLGAALSHRFDRYATASLALNLEEARFAEGAAVATYRLFAPELTGEYDRRDDALDPRTGYRISATLAPWYDFNRGGDGFRLEAEARAYLSPGALDRMTLALRARAGSILAAAAAEVPPDRLFFAGGGGSVRGHAYQGIGIGGALPDPAGGLSLAEISAEARFRLNARWSLAAFADAAWVGPGSLPGRNAGFAAGIGAGVRYHTALGPIRLDLALPAQGGELAFYAGLGQAF